VLLNKENR